MFTLAHIAIMDIEKFTSKRITLKAAKTLQTTCLKLTQGQHLDISYEDQQKLPIDAYWPMVQGKTAALISACTEIGALIAAADEIKLNEYRCFGRDLGLVFQLVDDILGIWGDTIKIGKSNASDLVAGKKSLPVLYGLAQNGKFARRWLSGPILPDEVPDLANQLEAEGAKDYAQNEADRLTESALNALQQARPIGKAGLALTQLANQLLNREI
jgi:geranylgeranyl diphosphate synthase type I